MLGERIAFYLLKEPFIKKIIDNLRNRVIDRRAIERRKNLFSR